MNQKKKETSPLEATDYDHRLYDGKIIKGIAGFYYVYSHEEKSLFECKAKGLFRNEGVKPLVGDDVRFRITDFKDMEGNIEELLPRKNEIIRPACANIDQAIAVMSASKPVAKLLLIDKIILFFSYYEIPIKICFNKCDEAQTGFVESIQERFKKSGIEIIFTSAVTEKGIDELKVHLSGKTSIFTGPSGVGKSSLLNCIYPDADSEVGAISRIGRGRHTTRHTELFCIDENTYVYDTPGFTSLELPDIDRSGLQYYYNEFSNVNGKCRFDGCSHIHEPGCVVREALERGSINRERYDSYVYFYNELKD